MALKAPQGNGNKQFAPQANIEPGTYPGRLVQLIDFGLQPQRPYMGKDKPPAQEIGLTYELVDEFMKDDDGNDIEFDGCHNCRHSCHHLCSLCEEAQCFACNIDGWYPQQHNCKTRCGDGIIAGNEVCDDSNDIPFDGCF